MLGCCGIVLEMCVSCINLSRKADCSGVIRVLSVWFSGTDLEVDRTVSGVMKLSFCLAALTVFVGGLLGNKGLLVTIGRDITLWLFCVKVVRPLFVCVMSSVLMGLDASSEEGDGAID